MTATVKVPNYTAEQTAELVAAYKAAPTKETVEAFAVKLGKTVRSVVAKLSREGVYQKAERVRKDGTKVEKKDLTADAIGAILNLKEADVTSLAKANRSVLQAIFKALATSKPLAE